MPWLTGNWQGQDPSQGTVLEVAIREDLAEIRENGEILYRGGYQITHDQVLPAKIQYPIFSLEVLSGDTDGSGEDSPDSVNSRIPNFQGMCKIDQDTLGIIIQRQGEPPRTVGMKRTEP